MGMFLTISASLGPGLGEEEVEEVEAGREMSL
jgi:hypothetical protein